MATVRDLPPWRHGSKVTFTQSDGSTLEAEVFIRGGNDLDKATTSAEPYLTEFGYGVRLMQAGRHFGTVRNTDVNWLGLWTRQQATTVALGIDLVQALA